jgi:hypothetical protein
MDASPSPSGGTDSRRGFLIYQKYRKIPKKIGESLSEAAAITGINVTELKMRLTGPGLGALTINRPMEELKCCAADLKTLGLKTAIIEKSLIKKSGLPASAKKINLVKTYMDFEDANGELLFRINKETDLLIIITDLSGQSVRQLMTAMAYTGNAVCPKFEDSLKKISIAKPAAIFFALNTSPVTGVYVDADIFSFMGLNEKMTHAKGTNFRVMVGEAMSLARSCVTDENFGLSLLPGASPDWNSDKGAIEKELGRYSPYIITAARNRLMHQETEDAQAEAISREDPSNPLDTDENGENSGQTEALLPPPDIQDSRIVSFFQTSLPEIIAGLIVLFLPFSMFASGLRAISDNRLLSQAVMGGTFFLAGLCMFAYALMLLYYRRLVENTPTSKIRSMSLGMVELSGKTRRYHDLRTPATQTPCVFYNSRRYKLNKTSEGSHWTLTRSVTSGKIPFYIEDDTGRVLVNPNGAVFSIPLVTQTFSGSYVPGLTIQLYDPDTKVTEDIIPVGIRVYVFGSANIVRYGKDTQARVIEKLRLLKQNPKVIAEYDANGDGRIDGTEWEAVRQDVTTQVYAETLTGHETAGGETVVIGKPRWCVLPFIVADSEKGLVRQLMIRTFLFLATGWMVAMAGVKWLVGAFG